MSTFTPRLALALASCSVGARRVIGAAANWLRHARNVLLTGTTGSGKTWLACALAHQAARAGFSVLYVRAARLFDELQVAHGDGSFARRSGIAAARTEHEYMGSVGAPPAAWQGPEI